jgi:hypothetical protein
VDCFLAAVLMVSDPPLADRHRFPSRDVASRAMQFNRTYRRHVELRQMWELHRWWYWQEVRNETDYVYRCWDYLHAAQGGEGGDESYWRRSLMRLRDLIGDEAYYLGAMPPPAPVWRFHSVE